MTLSWLENAEKALDQLTRITKPGGRIYLSSLFNLEHDVDLFTKIVDHSSNQENEIIEANYYTYSGKTIAKWLNQKVRQIKFYPFNPSIDFNYEGRGIGTYTVNTELGKKLQISAGLLMNWAVLEIEK
jgi:ubiquinone/menaquinone biosynthesis C-methylase UbiE